MDKSQRDFVGSNIYAIAEAGVEGYVPYAVYDGETTVGMLVFAKLSEGTGMIHHLMIGHRFQGRGYGRSAMTESIRLARERHRCRRIVLTAGFALLRARQPASLAGMSASRFLVFAEMLTG